MSYRQRGFGAEERLGKDRQNFGKDTMGREPWGQYGSGLASHPPASRTEGNGSEVLKARLEGFVTEAPGSSCQCSEEEKARKERVWTAHLEGHLSNLTEP